MRVLQKSVMGDKIIAFQMHDELKFATDTTLAFFLYEQNYVTVHQYCFTLPHTKISYTSTIKYYIDLSIVFVEINWQNYIMVVKVDMMILFFEQYV